jgi:hypothetical protein
VVWVDLPQFSRRVFAVTRNAGSAMPEADIHVRHFKLANSLAEYAVPNYADRHALHADRFVS